jgi:polysaccharide chain length determinant protein (PEP-CTERM system associated)
MDNLDFIKEIALAIKFELIRFRVAAAALAVIILFCILAVGLNWQKYYVSQGTLFVDDSNIIQPLLKGRAEFAKSDRVEEAKKTIFSRRLIESLAQNLGYINEDSSIEEIVQVSATIKRNITVESESKRSNYFTVSYFSSDPAVSFETANELIKLIVSYQKEAKREEGENAYGFISKRVDVYKKRLENAEQAVKQFKAESIDVDEETVQKRISVLDSEIQDLILSIQESETQVQTLTQQLSVESEYLGVQSKMYSLRQQKIRLEQQLSQLRMQYQESYPDIVSAKNQLNEIDGQINAISLEHDVNPRIFSSMDTLDSSPELLFDELRKQLNEAQREITSKKKREQSLKKLLEEQQQRMEIVASNQAELADLTREYNVTKEVYEEMLGRLQNAELSVEITKEGQGLTYRIVNEPSFPLSPTGLTFIHFLLAAPLLALGAPLGLIVVLVLLDPRIRTLTTLTSGVGSDGKVLAVLPHYNTAFSERILRKDILILSGVSASVFVIYSYIAYLGLTA